MCNKESDLPLSDVFPMVSSHGRTHLWEWGSDRPVCAIPIDRKNQRFTSIIVYDRLCYMCNVYLEMGKGFGRWGKKRRFRLARGVTVK